MKYTIMLHHTEEGYGVYVPDLPGCWSQGDTEEEAVENIKTAIREYLEVADTVAVEKEYPDPDIERIWSEEAERRFAAY